MRRDKTLKIVANHLVIDDGKGTFNLKEHPSSDKSWTYCAQDFSDGDAHQTTFAIRFANADGAQYDCLRVLLACQLTHAAAPL